MTENFEKDILTMLTREDSKRVADAIIEVKDYEEKIRMRDHAIWKQKQEQETESRLQLDQRYRLHVAVATILNMVSTAAIVLLVLKVVTVL